MCCSSMAQRLHDSALVAWTLPVDSLSMQVHKLFHRGKQGWARGPVLECAGLTEDVGRSRHGYSYR